MLIIDSLEAMARALDQPIDRDLKRLLARRRDQLLADTGGDCDLKELALFVVVEPGDSLPAIEEAAGYPVVTDGGFEWVERHGRWFEAVTILSDDGFGTVLVVPDSQGVDATLLECLREEAEPEQPSTAALDREGEPGAR